MSIMARMQSAGILLFRVKDDRLQMLLAHPGGPFWVGKDEGAWSIPKGMIDDEEAPLQAASERSPTRVTASLPTWFMVMLREYSLQ